MEAALGASWEYPAAEAARTLLPTAERAREIRSRIGRIVKTLREAKGYSQEVLLPPTTAREATTLAKWLVKDRLANVRIKPPGNANECADTCGAHWLATLARSPTSSVIGDSMKRLVKLERSASMRRNSSSPRAVTSTWRPARPYELTPQSQVRIANDQHINIAVGPANAGDPRAVDRRHVHVWAIEHLAQLQLNAYRTTEETRQGLKERIIDRRGEQMWARRSIPAQDARCLRSAKLSVNRRLWRGYRLGKLMQRPRPLGLQQQERKQSKLHLGPEER
jgi:hypothetical protein